MRITLGSPYGMPVPLLPEDPAGGTGGGEGGGDGGAGGGANNNGGADDKKFTQADLDRHIADRLRRAVPADYEAVKAKAAKLDQIEAANASDQDKAIQKATTEAEARVRAETNVDRVLDKVEVAAASTWADTTDARLRLRDRAAEFVKADGTIDSEAIKTAVADELKNAPHLAARGRPGVDGAQGSGSGGAPAAQLGDREADRRFGPQTTTRPGAST